MNQSATVILTAAAFTVGGVGGEYAAVEITASKPSSRHLYCAQVENWRKDAKDGISPMLRRGHHDRWDVYESWCVRVVSAP